MQHNKNMCQVPVRAGMAWLTPCFWAVASFLLILLHTDEPYVIGTDIANMLRCESFNLYSTARRYSVPIYRADPNLLRLLHQNAVVHSSTKSVSLLRLASSADFINGEVSRAAHSFFSCTLLLAERLARLQAKDQLHPARKRTAASVGQNALEMLLLSVEEERGMCFHFKIMLDILLKLCSMHRRRCCETRCVACFPRTFKHATSLTPNC